MAVYYNSSTPLTFGSESSHSVSGADIGTYCGDKNIERLLVIGGHRFVAWRYNDISSTTKSGLKFDYNNVTWLVPRSWYSRTAASTSETYHTDATHWDEYGRADRWITYYYHTGTLYMYPGPPGDKPVTVTISGSYTTTTRNGYESNTSTHSWQKSLTVTMSAFNNTASISYGYYDGRTYTVGNGSCAVNGSGGWSWI